MFDFMDKNTDIKDAKSLIALWPTNHPAKALAEDLGLSMYTVQAMVRRNTIDQKYLWEVHESAKKRGIPITAEQILKVMSREERQNELAA